MPITVDDCITAKGKLAEPPSVELDQRLRDYGLQAVSWDDSRRAFDAVTKELPSNLAPSLRYPAWLSVVLDRAGRVSGLTRRFRHVRSNTTEQDS